MNRIGKIICLLLALLPPLCQTQAHDFTPGPLWELSVSDPILEITFSKNGEFIAVVGAQNVQVLTKSGKERFATKRTNATGGPRMNSVAFNSENELLLWQSPNLLRVFAPATGELIREQIIPVFKRAEQIVTANFSPSGDRVVLGQPDFPFATIASTADGSEVLLFENLTTTPFSGLGFQWNRAATRLAIRRLDSIARLSYFQLLDLESRQILTYPVQHEHCPIFFEWNGTFGLRTSPRTMEGGANPICDGANVTSAERASGSILFPSGRYLGFRGGIASIDTRTTELLQTQIVDETGTPRLGMIYPNAGEREVFAVWPGFRIEGYAVEDGMFEAGPLLTLSLEDRFDWFDRSVSPDGHQIVVLTRALTGPKLISVPNPFYKPILRKPRLTEHGIEIAWVGSSGEYEIHASETINNPHWSLVRTTLERSATLPRTPSNRFYRISGRATNAPAD